MKPAMLIVDSGSSFTIRGKTVLQLHVSIAHHAIGLCKETSRPLSVALGELWLHLLLTHFSLVIIKGASNLGLTSDSNSLLAHRSNCVVYSSWPRFICHYTVHRGSKCFMQIEQKHGDDDDDDDDDCFTTRLTPCYTGITAKNNTVTNNATTIAQKLELSTHNMNM